MGDQSKPEDFRAAVAQMREWQKKYFRTPREEVVAKRNALDQSKYWEGEVDRMLAPPNNTKSRTTTVTMSHTETHEAEPLFERGETVNFRGTQVQAEIQDIDKTADCWKYWLKGCQGWYQESSLEKPPAA